MIVTKVLYVLLLPACACIAIVLLTWSILDTATYDRMPSLNMRYLDNGDTQIPCVWQPHEGGWNCGWQSPKYKLHVGDFEGNPDDIGGCKSEGGCRVH